MIGNELRLLRKKKKLSQCQLAKELGYGSGQFVSNIEREVSSFPIKKLKIIKKKYGESAALNLAFALRVDFHERLRKLGF